MATDPNLRGVGGWLAFFLVTLGVINPLVLGYSAYQLVGDPDIAATFGDLWPTLRNAELGLTAVIIAICWFACWRFLKVFNWTTVRIGIASLWAIAPLAVFAEAFLVSRITGLDYGTVMAEAGGPEMIRPFVYATVWTIYLLRSQRVRNTYGEGQSAAASDVFQ